MCYITHSLRFTSGATPADLLAASMAAEPPLPHILKSKLGRNPFDEHDEQLSWVKQFNLIMTKKKSIYVVKCHH